MRPQVQTNCTGMPMSERQRIATHMPNAWMHAALVAQWVVVLLGWIWLGEQGMRLTWSWASGLLPVALWWSARMLCRGNAWAFRCSAGVVGLMGLITAVGVGGLGLLSASTLAPGWLMGLSLLWGVWSALLETRSSSSSFERHPVAWHPVMAAVVVVLGWQVSDTERLSFTGCVILLVLCAGLLFVHERNNTSRKQFCEGLQLNIQTLLSPSAMGLMMGSLWLSNAWCVGLGWRIEQMVVIHLGLMAGLPTLVAYAIRSTTRITTFSQHHGRISLALLCWGALAMLGEGPFFIAMGMLLPSLAWAVHCNRPRVKTHKREPSSTWFVKGWALLLGPVLLTWVGLYSPVQGPFAIETALALLGGLAFLQLLHMWWSQALLHPPLAIPHKTEIPKT